MSNSYSIRRLRIDLVTVDGAVLDSAFIDIKNQSNTTHPGLHLKVVEETIVQHGNMSLMPWQDHK